MAASKKKEEKSVFTWKTIKQIILIALVARVIYFFVDDQQLDPAALSHDPFTFPASLQYRKVRVSPDLQMNVIEGGPVNAKTAIVFVHGFPETAYAWKEHMDILAAKGYRVLAPDTRYNNGTQPEPDSSGHVAPLSIAQVTEDLVNLVKATCADKDVFIAGHDWGTIPVWAAAVHHHHNVKGFKGIVSFNVPHPYLYTAYNLNSLPFSLSKIWYFLFWGLTGPVANWKVARNDYGWFKYFLIGNAQGSFSHSDIEHYADNWRLRGDTLLSYYWMGIKWLVGSVLPQGDVDTTDFGSYFREPKTTPLPVLQLFGSRDIYITPEMIVPGVDPKFVPHPKSRAMMYDATHWLPHEKPAETSAAMHEWIQSL
eukprot:GFYU01014864.1.p1 GENE.GFYU01014864.1~~GFYU01014864.1.p1  ORF type:complete len:368 (-),score=124.86 GFYU01014864.1:68-1171(-)